MKTSFITKSLLLMASIAIVGITASCDNSDGEGYVANRTELNQAWQIIGYGSGTSFHMIGEEYRMKDEIYGFCFYLYFRNDGTFEGRDAINTFYGTYTCKKEKIKINDIVSTLQGYPKGYEDSQEFINRLKTSTSYGIKDGNKLRIYSSEKEYLYFEAMEKPWYIEQ